MKYCAVYDTNVLISALLTKHRDSATARVLDAIASQRVIPLYNQEILDEYDEVLHRPKFKFSEGKIQGLLSVIRAFGIAVEPSPTGVILPDMDDLVFYEVVMEKRDDGAYLITGNIKHFPDREYIVTPVHLFCIHHFQIRNRSTA